MGTFVGSPMTHLWSYDGALAADGEALVLHAEGPSFTGEHTLAPYRDELRFLGPDERLLRASYQSPGGDWVHFMTVRYHRG